MENCQDVVMDLFKTLNNSKSETAFADPVFLFRWAGWIGMGWGFREMISFVLGGGGGQYLFTVTLLCTFKEYGLSKDGLTPSRFAYV